MLAIYDDTGYVFLCGSGFPEPVGLQHMYVDIPDGMNFTGVDVSVTPHRPIFTPYPKSEMEILKEKVAQLEANQNVMLTGSEE